MTPRGMAWLEMGLRNRNAEWRRHSPLDETVDDGRPSAACTELMKLRSTDMPVGDLLLVKEPRACKLKYLDLSYVDYVTQDVLVAVMRASCGVNDLRVKDYYGEEWRVSRGSGEPTRCAAANEPRSAPDSPR